ncbi:hypothetical protein H2248_007055 [Termitomyces sp. 'cryptogamus']|nr:hypothetical protein H2248_007055 [Termitomyces sp. 'cryptogamus']
MDELFGDDINEPLKSFLRQANLLPGDPYAALTAQWQQAFALPASTSTAQWQQTLALPPLHRVIHRQLYLTMPQDSLLRSQFYGTRRILTRRGIPTTSLILHNIDQACTTAKPHTKPKSRLLSQHQWLFLRPHDLYSSGCEQNSFDLSLAPPPAFVSMAPANCIQDPATHIDNYITHFTSPTLRMEQPIITILNPHQLPPPVNTSVVLAMFPVSACEWGSCGTVYQLEGNTHAEETAFQNRVLKHLSEHASLSSKAPEDRKLQCQWGDCHRRMSPTTKERGMIRHLQSHIAAWYYFCPNLECSHTKQS